MKLVLRSVIASTFCAGALALAAGPAAAEPNKPKKEKHYHVNKNEVGKPEAFGDGGKKRTGKLQVQVLKGRKAHDITVDAHGKKGDGADITIDLDDATDGVKSEFTLDSEAGHATIGVDGKTVAVDFNPDGTLSVDGTVYRDTTSAAHALVMHPSLKKLTPETYAAIDALITPPTAKFEAVMEFIVAPVLEIIVVPLIESAIDDGLREAGCDFSGWVWEWTCR